MEVLTAYVRETHPVATAIATGGAPWGGYLSPDEWEELSKQWPRSSPLATDIQAVLTVIGRRTPIARAGEAPWLDLRDTDLRGAALEGAHLERVWLRNVNLKEALLQAAHLPGGQDRRKPIWRGHALRERIWNPRACRR